jgi:glycosyltransferase involved in cell wall biosynthesis
LMALVAGRLLGIPYSVTAHARDIYVRPVLLRAKLLEAKFVCTCTDYNRVCLSQTMGEELNDRLHLVYHGLDLDDFTPPAPRLQSHLPVILSVGRLTEKKGFVYLIHACRLLKNREYSFQCHIVGEGPLRRELENLVTEFGLQDTVALCGAVPHTKVIEEYRQAALFVLPCIMASDGDRDGIPNVLIEAMAMELPVVSTCHSGIPELVQAGKNGILVPPGDTEALAGALAELLDRLDLRQALGQRGRQTVLENFDVERNVRRMFDLFVVPAGR